MLNIGYTLLESDHLDSNRGHEWNSDILGSLDPMLEFVDQDSSHVPRADTHIPDGLNPGLVSIHLDSIHAQRQHSHSPEYKS